MSITGFLVTTISTSIIIPSAVTAASFLYKSYKDGEYTTFDEAIETLNYFGPQSSVKDTVRESMLDSAIIGASLYTLRSIFFNGFSALLNTVPLTSALVYSGIKFQQEKEKFKECSTSTLVLDVSKNLLIASLPIILGNCTKKIDFRSIASCAASLLSK
ncbi:MAG: hypothetical protein J0H68_02975 [Sphingobacteriia bacterium]|nr:hypothetical protein [Sphingobacteriia bacterium]